MGRGDIGGSEGEAEGKSQRKRVKGERGETGVKERKEIREKKRANTGKRGRKESRENKQSKRKMKEQITRQRAWRQDKGKTEAGQEREREGGGGREMRLQPSDPASSTPTLPLVSLWPLILTLFYG